MFKIILFFMVTSSLSYSQSDAGEDYYDKGDYQKAVDAYELGLVKEENPRWAVLYNLGNAHYQNGDIARALASYLAARKINPGHAGIGYNIKRPLSEISDKLSVEQKLPAWALPLKFFLSAKSDTWLLYSSIFCFIFSLSLYFYFRNGDDKSKNTLVISGLITLFLLGGCVYTVGFDCEWVVVGSEKVEVYSGPSINSSKLFELKYGAPVISWDVRNKWVKVELSTGDRGWLKQDSLISYNK